MLVRRAMEGRQMADFGRRRGRWVAFWLRRGRPGFAGLGTAGFEDEDEDEED